ncbi:MAG: hypothetical protein ABR954_09600 [Dehalococcoidales bacterium]
MIDLKCEINGVMFKGTKNRPIIICHDCAGKLRKRGLGPVQLLGRPEIKNTVIKIMKNALGY